MIPSAKRRRLRSDNFQKANNEATEEWLGPKKPAEKGTPYQDPYFLALKTGKNPSVIFLINYV